MVGHITAFFPRLRAGNFDITSPATRVYNRIAWAAGDTQRWWWPDDDRDNDAVYWPPGVPREETVDAFVAAFATLGFTASAGDAALPGVEKTALFVDLNGVPTHAARQLPSGRWTSKLGVLEDISSGPSKSCAA
jgi:hypothetical protein